MYRPDTSDEARLHRAFDHLISLRARDVVDVADVMAWIRRVTTKERVAWGQKQFGTPIRGRIQARAKLTHEPLARWLPPGSAEKIAELLARPTPVPERIVDDVVRSEKIREEVRTMLSDTLSGFVKKGLGDRDGEAPKGPGAGLRSAIGLGARAIAGAGKGLLGNIGEEVRDQLRGRIGDFVDGSVEKVQEGIARKLRSPETAEALARHRRALFEDLLKRKDSEAAQLSVPWDEIEALVPEIVEHVVRLPEVTEVVEAELRRGVELLSEKTLRELLDELDLRDEARASFLIVMRPIIGVL